MIEDVSERMQAPPDFSAAVSVVPSPAVLIDEQPSGQRGLIHGKSSQIYGVWWWLRLDT